ncbi:hypothetical protein CTA2_8783, partial [Colletotrichum tanaceti]
GLYVTKTTPLVCQRRLQNSQRPVHGSPPCFPTTQGLEVQKQSRSGTNHTFHLAACSRGSLTSRRHGASCAEIFPQREGVAAVPLLVDARLFSFRRSTSQARGTRWASLSLKAFPWARLNDTHTIPLYTHNEAAWLLGRPAPPAVAAQEEVSRSLNLRDPALVTAHVLPPLGWSILRFEVTAEAATMIHAAKLRYFALGMSAPFMEAILADDPVKLPESAVDRPHVVFEPRNDDVFG